MRLADDYPSNLPIPLTSFVGREREVADVVRLLDTVRLVTLTGPGGTGQTRMALAVAARLRGNYPDGVWFVDLNAIVDPKLVASAVARVLGVRESEGRSYADVLRGIPTS